jgi:hypothetical protein
MWRHVSNVPFVGTSKTTDRRAVPKEQSADSTGRSDNNSENISLG